MLSGTRHFSLTDRCVSSQMLFLVGGLQMVVAEVIVAVLLGRYFTAEADWVVPENVGLAVLIIICIFVSGFAYRCQPPCTKLKERKPSLIWFTLLRYFFIGKMTLPSDPDQIVTTGFTWHCARC